MPKKRTPITTNNYMVFWMEGRVPHWIEFLGREPALQYYKTIKKNFPSSCRLYRMVIDSAEEI